MKWLVLFLVGCGGMDMTGLAGGSDSGVDDVGHVIKGGKQVSDAVQEVDLGAVGSGGTGGVSGSQDDWTPCSGGEYYGGSCLPSCTGGGVKLLDVKWCAPMAYPGWECIKGRLNGVNVKCPFDVAVAMASDWNGPCLGCIDDEIVTNGDGTRSASYRNIGTVRYHCDGTGAGPMENLGTRLCAKQQ